MQAVIQFFEGIGTAISSAIQFLADTLSDLAYVVKLLGKILLQLPSYFAFLPSPLIAIIVSIFTIAVIYKIIGRSE